MSDQKKKKWANLGDLQGESRKAEIVRQGKDYRPEGAGINYMRSDIREQDYMVR